MSKYSEILKALDENDIYTKVGKRLSDSALIAISVLKEKELDPRNDEFIFALINSVSIEAVRQSVAITLKALEQYDEQNS